MISRIKLGSAVGFLVLVLTVGCNTDNSPIGAGLVTPSQFDISVIDTVRLRVSTIVYDSLQTSGYAPIGRGEALGRLIFGHNVDEKLGPVTVSSVITVTPPVKYALNQYNTHYKSVSLFLTQDGYSYYDTTQAVTLKVYRLKSPPKYYFGTKYSKDTYDIDEDSFLGSISFIPKPKVKDSTEVFLSDSFGQELMTLAQTSSPFIQNTTNFDKYFYGFALVPDTTENRAIVGFKAAPVLRLTYIDDAAVSSVDREKRLLFTFTGTNQFFVKYDNPRTGTKLESLQGLGDEILTKDSDHEAYIQAGSGVTTRIIAPYVKDLTRIREDFVSTRSILTFTPVFSSDTKETPLPKTLNIDLVGAKNNNILATGYVTAGLSTDYFGTKTYIVDVTSYINGEVLSGATNQNALLIKIPGTELGSTVDRMYIHDQQAPLPQYKMKLLIYYLTLSE